MNMPPQSRPVIRGREARAVARAESIRASCLAPADDGDELFDDDYGDDASEE